MNGFVQYEPGDESPNAAVRRQFPTLGSSTVITQKSIRMVNTSWTMVTTGPDPKAGLSSRATASMAGAIGDDLMDQPTHFHTTALM
jgi:hypothetical protein